MRISSNWATAHFLTFVVSLGTVIVPVGVSFSLLMCYNIEAQGLVKVDLFPILDLFGSNQFMSVSSGSVSLLKAVPCPLPFCFTERYYIHFSRLFAIQTSLKR